MSSYTIAVIGEHSGFYMANSGCPNKDDVKTLDSTRLGVNKTKLIGRIVSVAAMPHENSIHIGFEAQNNTDGGFYATATIPCTPEHLAHETHWYAKLWKKKRTVVLEGSFSMIDGCIGLCSPDIHLLKELKN